MRKYPPRQPEKITDVIHWTDDAVLVMVARTGKAEWMPLRAIEMFPGFVMIPDWLKEKIDFRRLPKQKTAVNA